MATIYEMITQKILDRIDEAEKSGQKFFWVKPWTGGCKFAESYTSQKLYNGINQVILDHGEYISYKALMDYKKQLPVEDAEKIRIKKGCHKQPVFYYGTMDKLDESDLPVQKETVSGGLENEKSFFVRYYSVFHIEDIEGLPSRYPAEHFDHTPDENEIRLEKYILAYAKAENISVDIVKDGANCFYRPSEHMIRVPEKEGFTNLYGYYGAVLHEIIHSTSKGLNRELGTSFGTGAYSKEELVAELGSQMALNQFGIVPDKGEDFNSAAYIKGWASYLKDNKKQILTASSKAQKAVEYFIQAAEKQLVQEQVNNLTERSEASLER